MLTELGLESWVKTSVGKGLHVVGPLATKRGYEVANGFSQAVVQHIACAIPQRFAAKASAENRPCKIFIHWLRNDHAHGARQRGITQVQALVAECPSC